MVQGRFGKVAVAVALAAACALGATACGGAKGGAAATVNGTAIPEESITEYIENLRMNAGYTDDEVWATYLNMVGMTPETLRMNILNNMIDQELIRQYASEKGVEVSAEEVDHYVDMMRSNFSGDAEWAAALKSAGMTEDEYRAEIEDSLRTQALNKVFASEVQTPEEDLLETANLYASYLDGAKRSSHILFSLDDQELAQNVLDRIRSGELDFEDAAKEYSIDSSSENGGDVGWDKTATFVAEYQEALDGLEEGEMSGLVESQFGYHIIKCTEHFVAPDQITSIEQIPESFRDAIVSASSSSAVDSAYSAWLAEVREKANIVINAMPAKAPYNVAMPAAAASESAEAAGESASSSEASAESASASSASGN